METNYELKHKCLLVPLKVVLLVLAMLVGFTTYAQQGSKAKVANDQQLIEAIENPSVLSVELEGGYYPSLNMYVEPGTRLKKAPGSGSRADCQYYIFDDLVCIPTAIPEVDPEFDNFPNPAIVPDPIPAGWYYEGTAIAGTSDPGLCNCCPDDNTGTWTWLKAASTYKVGDTLYFGKALNRQDMTFWVTGPGVYSLRYAWGAPFNSEVQTEYVFRGPNTVELSAPDVCGTSTTVDFVFEGLPVFDFEITWDLYNTNTAMWYYDIPAGIDATGQFVLDVTNYGGCGYYQLRVNVNTLYDEDDPDCIYSDSIFIDLACDPIADAGPDLWVCDELCAYSLVGSTGIYTYSPTHAWSWVNINGPQNNVLLFSPNGGMNELEVGVCADGGDQPDCLYGEYEVQFQVQNGLCYDEDNAFVRFYEQPEADAGPDQILCNTFAFTLAAVPYEYCGVEGENYWSTSYWEVVSKADPNAVITFFPDEFTPGAYVTVTSQAECPFGAYVFVWKEENSKFVEEGCFDEDMVTVTIFEQPEVLAGDDQFYCATFEFDLDGTLDMPCYTRHAYTYEWTLVSQPGTCEVLIEENTVDPGVEISCTVPCEDGEYVFMLTQANGYYNGQQQWVTVCEDSEEVSVWIFEEPVNVDAGSDMDLCNEFAFSLTGSHDAFCGDAGVNNFVWYSWNMLDQPDECDVIITNGETLNPSVSIENCQGECEYGEYVFEFCVYNGFADEAYCMSCDEVTVTIFEQPEADAGPDVQECVSIDAFTYCYTMQATMEYCYTMHGEWTKSCGPGLVIFDEPTDPQTVACFPEPGRYEFVWTVYSTPGCVDSETVTFDLLEPPTAYADTNLLIAECDSLWIDLEMAGVDKYEYFGEEYDPLAGTPECPNYWDNAYWSLVEGPAAVTFANDSDPNTELLVTVFGCYTVRWTEVNTQFDEEFTCEDYVDIYVVFVETPTPFAGDDASFCCLGSHYGTYIFRWVNASGYCIGFDTVAIEFKKIPEEVPLYGYADVANWCGPDFGYPYPYKSGAGRDDCEGCSVDCLYPGDEVIEVCAESCLWMNIDWDCFCADGPIPGYTYEWSFIGPAGSTLEAEPYWYDCDEQCWKGDDEVYICFGECCDTARLYLTITSPQGCTTTEEWEFYVNHKPCAEIEGPEVAEVGMLTTYCNVCPDGFDMDCLLYQWTAEHCGEIVSGQGTECIEVLWTDYNVNGGWGEITLTTFDTCTGCCNYDEMMVKIHPAGTLGAETLSGFVYYDNNFDTPLNGVEITLWNGAVPVMTTMSFTDVEGGNGPGYYEFAGLNAATVFGVTAAYDAQWYGANATDALAVELKAINNLPGGFIDDALAGEAMDVNNSTTINGTDALWIKQRAIGMVNTFPAGDWVFEPGMTTTATAFDIATLNAGDANRSNVPNVNPAKRAIELLTSGTINVVEGQEFTLPIQVADAEQFGAITLSLEYNPALIEVIEVIGTEGTLTNISEGNVMVAWSSVNPMNLSANDAVMTLKVKAISEIPATEMLFSIGNGSEFADQSANVIEPVNLKTFGITTAPAAVDYFLSANRPNPFSASTTIEYTMPEAGKVRLSVLDMLGQEIAVIVDETQTAGSYTVEFSAAGLATGVYMYKITVDGESRDFISTQRMVITH